MARVETVIKGAARCEECGEEPSDIFTITFNDESHSFCDIGCAGCWAKDENWGYEHVALEPSDKVKIKVTCDYCKVTIGDYSSVDAPVKSVRVADRTGREITDEEFCSRNCVAQKCWNR